MAKADTEVSKVAALRATREANAERRPTPNLPALATKNARLPQMYEHAREALAECNRVDECKDWADKAQALASYARQANDDSLYTTARRIQGRAVRRAGELLKTYQADSTKNLKQHRGNGAGTSDTQRSAARAAGMSKRQEVTAVRVANVPHADFERAVESESPPTVTKLASKGRAVAEKMARESARPGFAAATQTVGAIRDLGDYCKRHPADFIAGGLLPREHAKAASAAVAVRDWLNQFLTHLRSA